MFIASIVGLVLAAVAAGVALYSGHIPVLRDLTGAAPLLPEEDHARDLARSVSDGFMTLPDWGPDPDRLQLPAADTDKEIRP